MLKVVIFDVDGVLVDSREANIMLYQTLLSKAGYPPASRDEILACFHSPLWQSLEKLTGVTDQDEIKRIWDLAPSISNLHLFEFPELLEETLEQLHQRYRLAIVTGRTKFGVENLFNAKAIQHLFDVVVAFEDYEYPKPHPQPLLIALEKLKATADEAIYIGDSESDIEAATAAGMKSIHLAPSKHKGAAAGVQEFKELLAAIDSLA